MRLAAIIETVLLIIFFVYMIISFQTGYRRGEEDKSTALGVWVICGFCLFFEAIKLIWLCGG